MKMTCTTTIRCLLASLSLAVAALACTDDGAEDTGMAGSGSESGDQGDGDPTTGDGDGDPGTGDGDGDPGTGDGDPGTGDGDGDPVIAEFAPVYQILMDRGCTAGYCHGANAGGLSMTDDVTAYMNLVNVDATTAVCGLQKRVVPSEPDMSIMWMRARPITLDMGMPCAAKMPQGTDGLDDVDGQVVYDWIAGGALP